jgi:predicted NBD/HSP70 family sugar kinase
MKMSPKRYADGGIEHYCLMSDGPTTCGICGARTSFEEVSEAEALQYHQCLNAACGYEFFVVDEEF